jgi:hypothetical protein
MLEIYEVVYLKETTSAIPLPRGTKGTVLLVHSENLKVYEVEFVDKNGKSLGIYTVAEADLDTKPD